jgi:hypothetical protein
LPGCAPSNSRLRQYRFADGWDFEVFKVPAICIIVGNEQPDKSGKSDENLLYLMFFEDKASLYAALAQLNCVYENGF